MYRIIINFTYLNIINYPFCRPEKRRNSSMKSESHTPEKGRTRIRKREDKKG